MDIFGIYMTNENEEKAKKMSAYMKDHFLFLGIQKPERTKISKEFLKEKKKECEIDWEFVLACYDRLEREFHYLAIDYLIGNKAKLRDDDIHTIEGLIKRHSWWDSTDTLNNLIAYLCERNPKLKEIIRIWMDCDNIWLRRVSILFQLKYKAKTDTEFLKIAIVHNLNSDEFFINKAIGWALREYSKTNQEWVRAFINEHSLSPLSVREASKYL
ncbi:DNA alkylation repair protein [Bacillus massiliigorillae]|uniref:DNA alkylation repair protein n=1 Tax=Bacillus massiliigorillae TaxID=1243664 RepID=UPI0003A3AA47|nr:DNA alkylation repair protein [Bacillus massiliigorillae]